MPDLRHPHNFSDERDAAAMWAEIREFELRYWSWRRACVGRVAAGMEGVVHSFRKLAVVLGRGEGRWVNPSR
jgi:hypothetical protein